MAGTGGAKPLWKPFLLRVLPSRTSTSVAPAGSKVSNASTIVAHIYSGQPSFRKSYTSGAGVHDNTSKNRQGKEDLQHAASCYFEAWNTLSALAQSSAPM